MASCDISGCPGEHGIVNGLCADHLRWRENFTAEELGALDAGLSTALEQYNGSPRMRLIADLQDQIEGVRGCAS